jgi:hypothetical protein
MIERGKVVAQGVIGIVFAKGVDTTATLGGIAAAESELELHLRVVGKLRRRCLKKRVHVIRKASEATGCP